MFSCVCCMLLRTHAFLYMWREFRCPISPWTLTQCPICELAISPGSDSWGAGVSLPARADSCSFPSSCPLTVEPCAASTSPECQHSCNYLELTSQALCVFPLQPPPLPLFFSQRTGLFICRTFAPLLCLCFPASLLSARILAGYKLHCSRVRTLLYSKHLVTFPHPQTWVIIHHLMLYTKTTRAFAKYKWRKSLQLLLFRHQIGGYTVQYLSSKMHREHLWYWVGVIF